MSSPYPPELTPARYSHLLELASDYALSHGLVLRPASAPNSTPSTTAAIHAPYALFPSPFPKELFEEAKSLQELYNTLYAKVTLDEEFLEEVVGGAVAKVDEFQGKLYELWKKVSSEGIRQPLHLGLFRSDYLLHSPSGSTKNSISIKQVEFNTISSSFGPLATKVGELHRYLLKAGAYPDVPNLTLKALPINEALQVLARGLAAGHLAYGNPNAKLLMVVQDHERNAFDQRALEWELQEVHNISVVRLPFSTLHHHATLSTSFHLMIDHPSLTTPAEISVVYYRAGYTPTDYPSSVAWSLRLLIERSQAIKCPTLALQLAGAKKVQQVLSNAEVLAKFESASPSTSTTRSSLSGKDITSLQSSFTSLYPLDSSPAGLSALSLAYSSPSRFVLKPQREGGGNNIYRLDIPLFLDQLARIDNLPESKGKPNAREGYILMDLIEPPEGVQSIMVRGGEAEGIRGEVISELGIYGIALFRNSRENGTGGMEMLLNESVGHLLRTKGRESDEGGVAVGFSVIDSPWLV